MSLTKNCWVIIPMEVKVRELDPRLYLALRCVQKGFRVIFGSKRGAHESMFSLNEPYLYISKGGSDIDSFFKKTRNHGGHIAVLDEEGGVWVACYGGGCAQRFDPSGRPDRRVEVSARQVTSLCFGGPDRRDLYVASSDNLDDPAREGTIFRTRVDVAGLPAPLARV